MGGIMVNNQEQKKYQKLKFLEFSKNKKYKHMAHLNRLIRCVKMKWVWRVWKIESEHVSVHGWTDRQGDITIPSFNLIEIGVYSAMGEYMEA